MVKMISLNLAPAPGVAERARGSVYFIGTATVLLRLGAFTLLTDPNFLHAGDHVHAGFGITARRLTNPAMEVEQLPDLDFCILSHMHDDHWDEVATRRLSKRLPVFTTPQAAAVLRKEGFSEAQALMRYQSLLARKGDQWLRVTALPGRHGPGVLSVLLPQVMGSLLEFGVEGEALPRFRMYISGDTLVNSDIEDIPRRYPNIDLALLHLGGTRALGLLVTMDGRQGARMLQILRPRTAIPIHYNDYTFFKSPLEDFLKELPQAQVSTRVIPLKHGESYTFEMGV